MLTLNLLPPEEKKSLNIQIANRRLLIVGLAIIFNLLIFISALGLIWFSLTLKLKNNQQELTALRHKLSLENFLPLQEKIQQINNKLETLNKIQIDHKYYSRILEHLLTLIPAETKIKTIDINENRINLQGFAPRRELVIQLKQNLETRPIFENIQSPIENFLKSTDIDFIFSFNLKKNAFTILNDQ